MAYLIDELEKAGVTNVVVCKTGSAFERYCLFNGITFHSLPFWNSIDLYSAYQLKKIAKLEGAVLMHLHSSKAHNQGLFAYLFGNKTPLVVSRRVLFPIKNNWFTFWKYKTPIVKKVICVSDAIKDLLNQQLGQHEKVISVHSGIDLEKFTYQQGSREDVRKKYGISPDAFLCISVASLTSEKNVLTYLKAAHLVLQKHPDVHFICVGDGRERSMLEAFVAEHQLTHRVHFTGFISKVPEVLSAADLCVLSSLSEGLGTSIIDAFASGVPVVASRVGGIPELVIDGETGFLADPTHPETFAEGMMRLIENPELRSEIIAKAHTHSQQFSKQQMGARTLDIYRSIIAL